jgi:hypothetical protein
VEIESLGPLVSLVPGASVTPDEVWRLHRSDLPVGTEVEALGCPGRWDSRRHRQRIECDKGFADGDCRIQKTGKQAGLSHGAVFELYHARTNRIHLTTLEALPGAQVSLCDLLACVRRGWSEVRR